MELKKAIIIKKEIWKAMYPGVNIFYDSGRTYNQCEQVQFNKFIHNAGVSFRLILHCSSSLEEFNFAVAIPYKNDHSPFFSFQTNLEF